MDDRGIAISCKDLVKRYGSVVAVDGLDLEIRTGECFGLLGPNGAGKTTTVEILEGLLAADSGDVRVLGMRWGSDDRRLQERLGIQLQETRLPDKLSVSEILRLFRSFYSSGIDPDEVIETIGLDEKRDAWTSKLSGGQKQRLAIGCALVNDPNLLFLDEPTTGLDPQARRKVWEIVERFRSRGRTVVLTTHYMEEAERLADRVAIIDRGRVIALGTPGELIRSIGAEDLIEFEIEEGAPLPDDDALGSLPGVRSVERLEARVRLCADELHRAVPALLARLERDGVRLSMLSTHQATLDDVFVSLTGRHLRDG
jgi:ABC-2 type transport system ATP-binding protein